MGFALMGFARSWLTALIILVALTSLRLITPTPSNASTFEPSSCGLYPGPEVLVKRVIDGDTVVLADDSVVRLLGIQAPEIRTKSGQPQAYAISASKQLRRIIEGKYVQLWFSDFRTDRYGRTLAHLYSPASEGDSSAVWYQKELVSAGLASVYLAENSRKCIKPLLAAEEHAINLKIGIWSLQSASIKRADQPETIVTEAVQIVSGKVVSVGQSKGRIFLNFGNDWKVDFTATVPRQYVAAFAGANVTLKALRGKRVRLRGWVREYNGPSMELLYPEQIQQF